MHGVCYCMHSVVLGEQWCDIGCDALPRLAGGGELLLAHGFPAAAWAAERLKCTYTISGLSSLPLCALWFVVLLYDLAPATYLNACNVQVTDLSAQLQVIPWWSHAWE